MDDRLIEFVRGLRAAGVRVSLAEALDSGRAASALGVGDRETFRRGLRAALVKDAGDREAFEALFPLYFGGDGPPLQNAFDDLSPDDEEVLRAALEALSGRLRRLLDWLTDGEGPSAEQLQRMAEQAERNRPGDDPRNDRWMTSQMLRQLGFGELERLLEELRERLESYGMSPDAIENVMGVVQENRESLEERLARSIGLSLARERAERPPDAPGGDLMQVPLQRLSSHQSAELRHEIGRLVARLRSRAALRQKRGRAGTLDPRRTIRANQRYGGVPMELRLRRRRLKPDLVLICDVSTSMRPVAEFMLRLTYELSDQVARARSFAFNDDLQEITPAMAGNRAADAVSEVLYAIPPGYYATDLGRSLRTFFSEHQDAVSARTTLIVLGDGRNNHNDPRVDLLRDLQKRARRLVWLNPEPSSQWGTDDSDMLDYEPICDAVYPVRDMAQLTAAVDRLLADR